jgi:membrane protein DedA with SNARE-associated domain
LNVAGALAWAAGIGLGAYFAGPPIEDLASDLGWAVAVGILLLVVVGVWLEVRRRVRRALPEPGAADGPRSKVVPRGERGRGRG